MRKILILCLISVALSATLNLETARAQMLTRHNYYRAQHQVDDVARSSDIESIAQNYSDYLASIGSMVHSSNTYNGESLGENLYWGPLSDTIGTAAIDLWYSEVDYYDFSNPGWNYDAGHFTQVVWKNSQQIGCGVGCGSSTYCYVTCNYYPAGNYLNSFASNVFAKSTTEETTSEDTTSEDTTSVDTTSEDTTSIDTTSEDTTSEDTTSEDTTTVEEDTTTQEDTSSSSSIDSVLETFRNEVTAKHNYYRNLHQVGDLERDSVLETIAQDASDYMVEIDSFSYPSETYNGNYIGKCLFYYWGAPSGEAIADMLYSGVSNYDFSNPGYNPDAGTFTQLVWKSSTKLGCGYACNGNSCYGICTYYPGGNYLNSFDTNVFPIAS